MPEALSPVADGDTARCVLVPRGGRQEPPAYTLFREQAVGDGSFVESLRVTSNRPVPTTVRLAVTADADFTDQFELRSDYRTYTKTGAIRSRQVLDDGVEFAYQRGEWRSCTTVTAEPAPGRRRGDRHRRPAPGLDPGSGTARHGRADPAGHGPPARRPAGPAGAPLSRRAERATPARWRASSWRAWPSRPAGRSSPRPARAGSPTSPRSRSRRPARTARNCACPAAGAPWFLTLLGRDALLTSLFALPYRPRLAAATLPALAATQATDTGPDVGRPARQDRARGTARRAGALRAGAVRPLLRLGGRHPAVPRPARRVRRAHRRHRPGPAPGVPRPGGDRLDAGPRRADLARLPRLPRRPGRPRQPELEGLPRRDLLRRRHPPAAAR